MTMHVDASDMDCSQFELRNELETLCDKLGVDVRIRFPTEESQSLAVLVTKESHCLETLLEEASSGELDADIDVVIGNHSDMEPLAREYDTPFPILVMKTVRRMRTNCSPC